MSDINWPATARIKHIEWSPPDPNTQINRSEWTDAQQIVMLGYSGRWSAKVEIVPVIGEAASLDWQAFVVECQGAANAFWIPATEGPQQSALMSPQVNGAGQTGYSLNVRNLPPGTVIKRGHKINVWNQMVMAMAPVTVAGDGTATISIKPYLRSSPPDGAYVEIVWPALRVRRKPATFTVDPGQIYGFAFEVEEAR